MMEELWRCFLRMNSLDIDPDQNDKLLLETESNELKICLERGMTWLIDKICEARLDPINVTLD